MTAPRLAYSVEEAADAIGVSRNFVGRLVAEGALPSFLLGRRRLISASALQAYIVHLEKTNGTAATPAGARRSRQPRSTAA